jgi:hypothetical protein
MKRAEEWDWPPTRAKFLTGGSIIKSPAHLGPGFSAARGRGRYRTVDVYQPSGWNSPGAKKAVRIYWQVTITIIKMLLAIPLSIIAIGAFWLLWTIITVALLHY